MIFSSKAEYGVRLMIELGRQAPEHPTSLKAIADAEGLPLAYLEQVVARLRKAGLVRSARGAHGGYWLSRPAEEIAMDEVVQALEGSIAPMECFVSDHTERVLCSHEPDAGRGCATKLLWTRVQGGIIRSLQATTLAELVQFSGAPGGGRADRRLDRADPAADDRADRAADGRRAGRVTETDRPRRKTGMPDLEIRNLHVRAGDKEILRGVDLTVAQGEIHALMGPNGSGKSTLANAIMGHPNFEVTEGQIIWGGEDITEADTDERARMGLFMAFQYPVSIPGRDRHQVPAHRDQRPPRRRRRGADLAA